VAGIVGFGKACEIAVGTMTEESRRLANLRNKFIKGILEKIGFTQLNGHPTKRLPGNVNVSVKYVEGESMLLKLDGKGICASSGSACTSSILEPSHVLTALGVPPDVAHSSLRFTLGRENTKEDVDDVLGVLPDIVKGLRLMSPLYQEKGGS
jgi:cysteine desulfurase